MSGGFVLSFGGYFEVTIRLLFLALGMEIFECSGDFFVAFGSAFLSRDLFVAVYS
jgi:hypothetical protein